MEQNNAVQNGDVFTNDFAEWTVVSVKNGNIIVEDMMGERIHTDVREILEKFAL